MKLFASFATCILALTISIAQAQRPQKSKPRRIEVPGGVLQGAAIKKAPPPYPPIARAARAAGKVEVQVTIFDKVIDLYPDDPEAYNGRGQARRDRGDKAGALADFNKAISLDPNFGPAYFNRGFIHGENGDRDKATADFVRAREDPRFTEQLGIQTGLSLKPEEEEVNQAIAANPREATAYRRRAGLRMVKGDLDGAIADETKAIELEPRDAKSYDNRGVLPMSKDDLDGAIADFTKAIELDSKSALFYANRGRALLLKGKEAEAQRDFDRCFKLNPGFKPGLERQIKAIKEQRAKTNR